MAIKSVTIIIDQFSDRIFDLGHDNIHLYDYGNFHESVWTDNYYNVSTGAYSGYFSYDDFYFSRTDDVGSFYLVTPDDDVSPVDTAFTAATTNNWDYDLKASGSGSFVDSLGYTAFYDTYYTFFRTDQTDDASPNHGDWTLAAYLDELEDPDQNEIICIDVDTLNGASSHYSKLFDSKLSLESWLAGDLAYITGLEAIIESFLKLNDKRFTGNTNDDEFTLSCLSVSIAGAPATQELSTLNMLASLDVPIIQAAPNVGQGDYDWGSNYADVINVGAWNVDNEGELLLSSGNTLSTLDILGNGQVLKSDWGSGSNFGTSFATPKVAADITNLYNDLIDTIENEGTSLGEAQAQSQALNIDYADIVNVLLDEISTELVVTLDEDGTQATYLPKVRTSDVNISPTPVKITSTSGGLSGFTVASAELNEADNSNDTARFSLTSHTNSADWDFYVGTELDDKITGQSDSVYLGLGGNDEFVSGLNAEHQVFIGLEGADSYEISDRGVMSIVEIDDGSKNILEASGIGFNSTTTYALTIDNQKHLVVGDTTSLQQIYLIGWDQGGFDSSTAILSDGEYSGEYIRDVILTRPNYLGDFSWEELAQQGVKVTPNIRDVIADTKLWAESLSEDGEAPISSAKPPAAFEDYFLTSNLPTNAGNIPLDFIYVGEFSEDITAGSGSIRIFDQDGEEYASLAASDARVAFDNKTLSVNFAGLIPYDFQFTASFDENFIRLADGTTLSATYTSAHQTAPEPAEYNELIFAKDYSIGINNDYSEINFLENLVYVFGETEAYQALLDTLTEEQLSEVIFEEKTTDLDYNFSEISLTFSNSPLPYDKVIITGTDTTKEGLSLVDTEEGSGYGLLSSIEYLKDEETVATFAPAAPLLFEDIDVQQDFNSILWGGDDYIEAPDVENDIYSFAGDDFVKGGDKSDQIHGGIGNDTLLGYSGDDQLFGEGGDDWLWGGYGNDIINGGSGYDTVELYGLHGNYDFTKGSDASGDYIDVHNKSLEETDRLYDIEGVSFFTEQGTFSVVDTEDLFDPVIYKVPTLLVDYQYQGSDVNEALSTTYMYITASQDASLSYSYLDTTTGEYDADFPVSFSTDGVLSFTYESDMGVLLYAYKPQIELVADGSGEEQVTLVFEVSPEENSIGHGIILSDPDKLADATINEIAEYVLSFGDSSKVSTSNLLGPDKDIPLSDIFGGLENEADNSNDTARFSLTSHTNSADWDFYVGTELDDKITGQSDSVYLGLGGNDEFVSGLNAEHQVFIGLEGADSYEISDRGVMSIVEIDDGSKNILEASGIGFNSTTTYALTIDNQKHLVVGDTTSLQQIYLIGWDQGGFDSSTAILSDGEYSGEYIRDVILTRPNYLGDFSWEELAQQGVKVTPNIRDVIADTKLWAESLSEDDDNDNDSSNPSDVDTPVFQRFSGNGNEVSYNENNKQLNIKTADGIDLMATLPQRSDVVEYEQQDYHYAYEFSAAISNTAAIVSYSGERDYRGEILGQVYGFDGSRIGDEILFSSQTDQGHRSSIWTIDGDRFLALWQTNNPDWLPPLDDMVGYVVGRVYNASDNSLEDTFVVAAQTNLLDTPPSIEISNTGAFNISWIEYDLTGDQLGASEMVYGGEINELISGSASADYLYGQGGDDEIDGGAGDDLIDGGIGDDILTGGDGDDIIIAGDGEDLIIGGNGEGDDIYDGGSGSDTIKYTSARAGITVELESGLAFSSNADEDAEIGRDAISAVENIIAGDFSDYLSGSIDANIIQAGDGSDLILAGAGNDTIIVGGSQTFSSSYQAVNTSSTTQVGTGDKVTLEGMLRVEDVIDGGADTDTIELGKGNVAFFLHDAFSGFHSSVQLSSDSTGEQSKARLENIEKISGNDSDVNIIDLTSSDYSLARQSITIDGAGGRDIVWGSDANETIKGGDGDDVLFGGAGINVLTGGAGADEFQFTMTSKNDSVTNFNAAEGDTLKFFNTGGAEFDKSSAILSDGKLTIDYGSDANDLLTIDLGNTALTLSDVSDSLIFV